MKEVHFKTISIKNFLSIGDEPIEIKFEPGIHIITGINKDKEDSKNGVGKSSISDAIFFALFGSPLRPIKKDVITNWVNKKECSVTLSFDVINNGEVSNYILLRSLNPSRVQLICNGEDISRTIGKTNETIYGILGSTPEMFEQSVIMCLNQVEPFLAKTPAIKRKFIEDIFKIEIFGKMTQYIRTEGNELTRIYDTEVEKASDIENNINMFKKQKNDQEERKKARIVELQERKQTTQDDINILVNKKQEIESSLDSGQLDKNHIQDQINKLKTKETEIIELDKQYTKTIAVNQTIILNLKNKISELEKLSDGVCAYCKQPFSESNKQEKKDLIHKHQQEIAECNVIIDQASKDIQEKQKTKNQIEDLIDELNQKKKTFETKEFELKQISSQIDQQTKWLEQVDKDIEKVSSDVGSFDEIINESTVRLDALTQTINEYKNRLKIIDTSKFIVSDEGVKNFIVKKMLKMLNGRLSYYLKQLDANCICQFNEYFDETIINNRGNECSYFNFSGGERKRIDLAMLFTFMDIRKTQSNIFVNIALYDELLDTSLDSIGIENTLSLLKERAINNKEAIYIISHKNEAAKHATGEVIYLEKENDITRRKTYV